MANADNNRNNNSIRNNDNGVRAYYHTRENYNYANNYNYASNYNYANNYNYASNYIDVPYYSSNYNYANNYNYVNYINPLINIDVNAITNIYYELLGIPIKTEIAFTTDSRYIGEQCSICWENVENIETMAVTKCSERPHVFHQACIRTWTATSNTCPNCRAHL